MYSAIDLAKYIVRKCIADKLPISNLQLQKILYYIQKYFLQSKCVPFFYENIEAWIFGPVVPSVYYYFSGAGAMPITLCEDIQGNLDSIFSEDEKAIINKIVEEKRLLNPWDMVAETHKLGGAWATIYQNGAGNHKVIPISEIISRG